jgi:hypothetical protein
MTISPMAMGMFVVPAWKRFTKAAEPGTKWPTPTPAAIARNIQSVRKRSRKESFFRRVGEHKWPCVVVAATSRPCSTAQRQPWERSTIKRVLRRRTASLRQACPVCLHCLIFLQRVERLPEHLGCPICGGMTMR